MYGVIYKITNKINGMRYIGQTKRSVKKRFNRHANESACPYMYKAIQKYGKENFEISIISRCNSIEEMNHREIYYIKLFNTITPNGYNISLGGNGWSGLINRRPSEEERNRISQTLIKRYENDFNLRLKILLSNPKVCPIYCHETKTVYFSAEEACRKLNLRSNSKILDVINRISKSYKNYTFRFATKEESDSLHQKIKENPTLFYFNSNFIPLSREEKSLSISGRKPVFCQNNQIIYASATDALRDLQLRSKSKIFDVLNGIRTSYRGFIFSIPTQKQLIELDTQIKDGTYKPNISKQPLPKFTKEDRSLSIVGRKAVFCHQNGKNYISMKSAAQDLGLKTQARILAVIEGRSKSYRGYTFSLVGEQK